MTMHNCFFVLENKWNVENISDEVCRGIVEALGDPYAAYYTKDDYFRITKRFEKADTAFSDKTAEELKKALDELDDLRDNAGVLKNEDYLECAMDYLAR